MPEFVAIDGEGITDEDTKEHRYILCCASTGTSCFRKSGLSTRSIFRYLLGLAIANPHKTFVGFGIGYDVNLWLRDLSRKKLEQLWTEGETTWKRGISYYIEWIPGKMFTVRAAGTTFKVYDVFGFFQSSFLRALEDWNIETPDIIGEQKGRRSEFSLPEIQTIRQYCIEECRLLVEMMERLASALDSVGLTPHHWFGPGAVASKMLRSKIRGYHVHDTEWPRRVQEAIMHAYFGGRVEMFMQGLFSNVTVYDIRSAYPWGTLYLPGLAGGKWKIAKKYDSTARYALWFVRWKLPRENPLAPFPFRWKRDIYWSNSGAGWYHGIEVRHAKRIFGDRIEVESGYTFQPMFEEYPFDFVRTVFNERRRLKEEGHAGERAYKLALNSMYGKLAQGYGYKGSLPPFQSFVWAGAITAATRARMLDMMAEMPRHVIFSATDSVAFSGDPQFAQSAQIGGLERSHFKRLLVIQPGIYSGIYDDGQEYARARGFFSRELDFEDIEELWLAEGRHGVYVHDSTRFCGLGTALMRTEFEESWNRWQTRPRSLNLYASRKWYDESGDDRYGWQPRRVERLFPEASMLGVSEPYDPKRRHHLEGTTDPDFVQGLEQPFIDE